MARHVITSPKVITPRRAFSNGVRVGQTLYVAGQLPIDPVTARFASDPRFAALVQKMGLAR